MRTGFLVFCIFFVCSPLACEGNPRLKFLQKTAKILHVKEPDVNDYPTSCNPIDYAGDYDDPFSGDDQNLVEDRHNDKRLQIANGGFGQPTASNMNMLRWDPELADYAARYAYTCPSGHSNGPYGENISTWKTSYEMSQDQISEAIKNSIDSWFNEVKEFDPDWINPYYHVKGLGHYTQMVWAKSMRVGCGYAQYPYSSGDYNYMLKIVCNYQEKGNWSGKSMYHEGPPCDECLYCVRGGLCYVEAAEDSNTNVIIEIRNTFHTVGIDSFTMYGYLTQPF